MNGIKRMNMVMMKTKNPHASKGRGLLNPLRYLPPPLVGASFQEGFTGKAIPLPIPYLTST